MIQETEKASNVDYQQFARPAYHEGHSLVVLIIIIVILVCFSKTSIPNTDYSEWNYDITNPIRPIKTFTTARVTTNCE
jgi:hypothetical protein